jgi:hypothetical protein
MILLKPVFIIAIVAVAMIGVMVPSVYAETWYYYVEPLPEYASYANNVMELSTTAWEDANDNLQFIEVSSPQQANFQVQWVKEFGVEHVGYAFGSWFIEVGLGDSNCVGEMWQPYSEKYTTNIMTHEIGHVLGFDHVNDPDSIMYPTAINWEYGNVETKKTLTSGYAYFQPICTSKDVTTFDWHVSSDDPTYGFDVYFVPSKNEFNNWIDGESFDYFDGDGCYAENMLSVGGTCEGLTQDSGLLVVMGDTATEPLTDITLNLQENNFGSAIESSEFKKSSSNPNPDEVILIDTTFSLYVDPQQEFSIKYPSNWIVSSDDNMLVFTNYYDWTARLTLMNFGYIEEGDGFDRLEIFETVSSSFEGFCNDATINDEGYICHGFQKSDLTSFDIDSSQKGYFMVYDEIRQYDSFSGTEYPMVATIMMTDNGESVWLLASEVDQNVSSEHLDIVMTFLTSFRIIQTGEGSSTTNSNPIPIPQPTVITSAGTAALSKTSVNVSSGQSEQVKIYGIVSNVDKSARVSITYTYPDGTTDGGTIFTTDTGVYETYLNLDKNSPMGNYEILVTAKGKILGTLILQVNDGEVLEKQADAVVLVKIFGDEFTFEHPNYQMKNPHIFFADGDGNSIHRYHENATMEFLFNSMSIEIDHQCYVFPDGKSFCTNDDYSLKYFINGKLVLDIRDYVVQNNDRILITFGGETDNQIQEYLSQLNSIKIESGELPIESKNLGIASFVDTSKDPQHYIDRYNNEQSYKEWFDNNYSQYNSIYQAVGLDEPSEEFVSETPIVPEPEIISEPEYVPEPTVEVASTSNCGTGTELVNGICKVIQTEEKSSSGGGCLIATATYGSEMSQQVQQLRELRDNQLLQTESGTAFMGIFNDIYYSFSPVIADYERENPYFKEAVKLAITPMISSLSLMENANSESEVLGIGISVIMLNLGMYLGVPAIVIIGIRKKF